jgi:hypothetical protein
MGVGKEMIGQARQFKFTMLACIMRVSLNFGFEHSLKKCEDRRNCGLRKRFIGLYMHVMTTM